MDEKQYIEFAATTDIAPTNEMRLPYFIMGFCEEAGEVAGKFKRIYRDDGGRITLDRRNEIITEIGDLYWYTCQLLQAIGATWDEVRLYNHTKLSNRLQRGTLHGSGDQR